MELPNLRSLSHTLLKPLLVKGGVVVDATAGRGQDTLFLGEAVGPEGQVYAFDSSDDTVVETMKRLDLNHHADRVSLQIGHPGHLFENMPGQVKGNLQGCMFNLCDRRRIAQNTAARQEATERDVRNALNWLAPGGFVSVLAPGGLEWLEHLARGLDAREFECLRCESITSEVEVLHVMRRLKHRLGSNTGQDSVRLEAGPRDHAGGLEMKDGPARRLPESGGRPT